MNLVLYSKLTTEINLDTMKEINNHLLKLINKDNPSIGSIAYYTEEDKNHYNKTVKFYNDLGITNVLYFDIDKEYDESTIDNLFQCDVIHLPGGNTFSALYLLKKRNLISKLQNYVKRGGIILGISAGALIPSPTIGSAQFGDENDINLTDLSGLNLIDFEIMPHWNRWPFYLDDLKKYSIENNITIYTVEDGQGIVIQDDNLTFYGDIGIIKDGVYSKEF